MENKYEYASAPYNFIPFPDKVVYRHYIKEYMDNSCEDELDDLKNKSIDELPYHDKFYKDLKSGHVDYIIKTQTPMFIGDGSGNFFKVNDTYTIPGSTVRGKVRSNAEILSWSYPEFIEDKRLWYRGAFSDDVLKKIYRKVLLPEKNSKINDNVKAGYLTNENGQYKIISAREDKNHKTFRSIHEGELCRECGKIKKDSELISFMYFLNYNENPEKNSWNKFNKLKNEKKSLENELKKKIGNKEDKELNIRINKIEKEKKDILKNSTNRYYKPYHCNIKYKIDKDNKLEITDIKKFDYDENYGILMNSNKIKGSNKQNHYIIYAPDLNGKPKIIDKDLKVSFETNVRYSIKNTPDQFKLPDRGKTIPVFYVLGKNNKIDSFGFTPYLKIAYEKSVLDGLKIKREYKNQALDYVQSIFGFANFSYNGNDVSYKVKPVLDKQLSAKDYKDNNVSYKGRVYFTNAKLCNQKSAVNSILKSLMNPKINSFQLYLQQNEIKDEGFQMDKSTYKKRLKKYKMNLKTYSGDFNLRGQKFYWIKDKPDIKSGCKNKADPQENQFAELTPIESEAEFKGRIYFENLSNDELGLLLMSIKPFEEAVENIGQGKPYGFGKAKFNILDVKAVDFTNRFKKFNCREEEYVNLDIEKCKKAFEDFMKNSLGCKLKETYRYKCFCISKYKNQVPKNEEIEYMELKEFKDRKVLRDMNYYVEKSYEDNENESGDINMNELVKKFGSKFGSDKVSRIKNK
jgi:CRISPR-associated protein (TIGR03986 family)